jgi:hypothetical protein
MNAQITGGSSVTGGQSFWNSFGGGVVTLYDARTDDCGLGNPEATGTEWGCLASALPGQDGGVMIFQERPGDTYTSINGTYYGPGSGAIPIPPWQFSSGVTYPIASGCAGTGSSTGGFGTGWYDPDFHSQLIVVSDPCNPDGTLTSNYSMSETNDSTDVANTDSTMFYIIKSGGGKVFYYLNPTYTHARTSSSPCAPGNLASWMAGTLCLYESNIAGVAAPNDGNCSNGTTIYVGINCTQMYNGGQTFSHKLGEANISYEQSPNGIIVYRDITCRRLPTSFTQDAICSTTATDTFQRTVYANFGDPTYGVVPSDYQVLWTGTFGVAVDGSMGLAAGGAGSYQTIGTGTGGAQTLTPDTFILPVNNNARWVLPLTPATIFTPSGSNTLVTFPFTPSGDTIPNPPTTPHVVITGLTAACNGQWPVASWSTPSGGPYTVTVTIPGSVTTCGPSSVYPGNIGYADAAYQACNSTGCTSGTSVATGTEPNWMSSCQGTGDICTDGSGGTVTNWNSIGNLNGQGPGFDIFRYGPPGSLYAAGYSRMNTRLGKVYRGVNEGMNYPASGTSDPGQAYVACGSGGTSCGAGTGYGAGNGTMYTNDGLMCEQYFNYLPTNGQCPTSGLGGLIPFSEFFTLHDSGTLLNPQFAELSPTGGGSGTGLLNQEYSPVNTVPMCLPSSATWRTDVLGGPGNLWPGQYNSTYSYNKGDAVSGYGSDSGNLYVSKASGNYNNLPSSTHSSTGPWYGAGDSNGGPNYCYRYTWQPNTNVINPCMMRHDPLASNNFGNCPGHTVHGFINEWGDSLLVSHLYAQFTLNGVATSLIGGNITTPGTQLLPSPNGIPADQHGMARSENSTDTNPAFSANTDVPTMTYQQIDQGVPCGTGYCLANPGQSAGYSEITGFLTYPAKYLTVDGNPGYYAPGGSPPCTTQSPNPAGGVNCFYRFAHSYNDGISSDFAAQNNISSVFQLGDFILMPTTVMGTRGSTSYGSWQSAHSYSYGTYLNPIGSNKNSNGYEWVQINPSGCTSASGGSSAEPSWNGSTTTITDGSGGTACTWLRQAGSCNSQLSQVTLHNSVTNTNATYSNIHRYSPENVNMAVGDVMFPVGDNGAENLYVAVSAGQTGTGNAPNWGDASLGCPNYGQTCNYGGVTLQSIGPDTCRAEVLLIDTLSAH